MKETESIFNFGGWLKRYEHPSTCCGCEMTFSVFLPPAASEREVPAVYYLSGLTCTDDNVRSKAGAQRVAAELGLALIMPDTSPRGDQVADAPDRYDLGKGAGFYVNASQAPWAEHYHMYDYVVSELPALVEAELPVSSAKSVCGHSMGGHGALICALKNPGMYRSVSAFAPICNPVNCGWGEGCFGAYLGDDKQQWQDWDACCLLDAGQPCPPLLVDQGSADNFLADQLNTDSLQQACDRNGIEASIRMQENYDHSYYFIASFIEDHLQHHSRYLHSPS